MIYPAELARWPPPTRTCGSFASSPTPPGTGDLDGLFSTEQLEAIDPAWRDAETYVCGPAPLMDGAATATPRSGAADRLHTEAFTLTQVLAEAGTTGGAALRRQRTGRRQRRAAASSSRPRPPGWPPPHGCRMGICHTCTRSLTGGTVRDVVTGDLDHGPGRDRRPRPHLRERPRRRRPDRPLTKEPPMASTLTLDAPVPHRRPHHGGSATA